MSSTSSAVPPAPRTAPRGAAGAPLGPALLVVDAAGPQVLLAALGPEGVACQSLDSGAAASAGVLDAVAQLLGRVGVAGPAALDAIGYGQGPGAFTGLRTAVSVAQGLAFGAGCPVIGVDSLALVAEAAAWAAAQPAALRGALLAPAAGAGEAAVPAGAAPSADASADAQAIDNPAGSRNSAQAASTQGVATTALERPRSEAAAGSSSPPAPRLPHSVLAWTPAEGEEWRVAMDARMGELYVGQYRHQGGRWQAVWGPRVLPPAEITRIWQAPGHIGVPAAGDGLALLAEAGCPVLPRAEALPPPAARALALLRLAWRQWQAQGGADVATAQPVYVRDKVAETTAERAARARGVTGGGAGAGTGAGAGAGAGAGGGSVDPAGATAASAGAPRGAGPRWRIRPMVAEDLDAVHAIEVGAYSHPWTRGNIADSLAAGHWAWVLEAVRPGAEASGSPRQVGHLIAMPGVEEVHLLNVTVAPEWRRQGAAGRLLAVMERRALGAGLWTAWLEVRVSNTAAQALYRQQGWQPVAQRRGYYPAVAGREDAWVMKKELPRPGVEAAPSGDRAGVAPAQGGLPAAAVAAGPASDPADAGVGRSAAQPAPLAEPIDRSEWSEEWLHTSSESSEGPR